jgi:hypothetical protein
MVCTKCGMVGADVRPNWKERKKWRSEGSDRGAMATLNDERRRALRLLARYPDGCAEAVLLAEGFAVGQLAVLVVDGFAKMYRTPTEVDGRQKNVIWMEITEEGRNAIAE